MNPVTQTLIKVAFLAMLWLFVIAAVGVMRADLFSSAASRRKRPVKKPRPVRQATPQPVPQGPPPPQQQPYGGPPPGYGGGGGPLRLVVTEGPRAGTTIDLGGAPITIGRANDATLVVVDDYASSRH